jgi:hypothetical protein
MPHALPDSRKELSVREIAAQLRREVERFQPQARLTAPLVGELISRLDLSVAELAGELHLAPQTIHRWRGGKTVPRPRQIHDLMNWLESRLPQEQSRATPPVVSGENLARLGIRLADEILAWEREAAHVWIVKSGVLRENVRGTIGQSVLRALQNGAHFDYVFLESTPAAESFRQFTNWLSQESFGGQLRGHCVSDPHLARVIGLNDAPGAWIGLEYSAAQIQQLGRTFDVFFALATREYADVNRTQPKNEDGQAIWVELATPQAARWLQTLKDSLKGLEEQAWRGVEVKSLGGAA